MGYSLDSQANVTVMGETQLLNLSQGAHNIILYANDAFSNMGNSGRIFFSVDTIPPNIMICILKTNLMAPQTSNLLSN